MADRDFPVVQIDRIVRRASASNNGSSKSNTPTPSRSLRASSSTSRKARAFVGQEAEQAGSSPSASRSMQLSHLWTRLRSWESRIAPYGQTRTQEKQPMHRVHHDSGFRQTF